MYQLLTNLHIRQRHLLLAPGSNLTVQRSKGAYAATGSETAGYFAGGLSSEPVDLSTVDKITYSTETTDSITLWIKLRK